jgi:hypothetical protein
MAPKATRETATPKVTHLDLLDLPKIKVARSFVEPWKISLRASAIDKRGKYAALLPFVTN